MTLLGIICRLVKQSQQPLRFVHDWVVYKLGALLGSVGHRVKIHNITPGTGKERGDMEIKDYVVMHDYVVFDFHITSFLARSRCNVVNFNPMSH